MTDLILLDVADGVATMTFNRPDQMNTLDIALAEAFERRVTEVLADPTVRVLQMQGAGRSFMAGGDLVSFRDAEDTAQVIRAVMDPVHRALKALDTAPVITLAVAQGPVAGGGMSIFLGADLGICADTASFNMAYARIATTPDCGGTWALPRLVGLRRAMELVLLSETVAADTALTLGLVNRVVPDADLSAEAAKIAGKLARGPAHAQGQIKALIRRSLQTEFAAQLDAEQAGFLSCAADPDFMEGLNAFFGKRKPDYSGA